MNSKQDIKLKKFSTDFFCQPLCMRKLFISSKPSSFKNPVTVEPFGGINGGV